MAAKPFLTPGIDLLAIPDVADPDCGFAKYITVSQLQQLLDEATPGFYMGMIWFAAFSPDTGTYPELQRCLWMDTTAGQYILKYFDAGWHPVTFGAGTLSGTAIQNNTLPITKLDPGAGNNLKIIRVNTGGTDWEFVDVATAVQPGTLTLDKLLVPLTAANGALLTVISPGVCGFVNFNLGTAINSLPVNTIDYNKISISGGTAAQALRLNAGATAWEWFTPGTVTTVPAVTGADDGKFLGVTGGIYVVQNLPAITFTDRARYGTFAVPATPGAYHVEVNTFSPNIPYFVDLELVFVGTPHDGFNTGQVINAREVCTTSGDQGFCPWIIIKRAADFTVFASEGITDVQIIYPASGDIDDFDPTEWLMRFVVAISV